MTYAVPEPWLQVTASARLDEHPKCNSIRLGKLEQDLMARKLHNTAGIALQRCGIDEIKAFQNGSEWISDTCFIKGTH